jgi:NADH-quinone oxidoreductase subunit G
MVSIHIDGKVVEAEPGAMIIEAADKAGFRIPRFCYHKKLSVAANCRMCLVEVGNAPKPLPACATPVSDGMVIQTRSPKAIEAQKSVMEFLLINHPLDCPICDQGGECELQDVAMGYGSDVSRFNEGKRAVTDKNLGPLIATDMTRCIHCTRCVRFGKEVAGVRELGLTGRGEHVEIGTFIEQAVTSELSGNIIDVCPVGALTSKPFRFKARAWELLQRSGVAAHDALGSNVYWHVYQGQILRVVPRENEAINQVWLSDRDRFSYQGFRSIDRLSHPKIRDHGVFKTVSWAEALTQVVAQVQKTQQEDGAEAIAALISPNETTEVCYLTQKVLRQLGSSNIDHRLKQQDFRTEQQDLLFPALGLPLSDIAEQDWIVLIGSDIQREQPLLSARLFQATTQKTRIIAINPVDFPFAFPVTHRCTPARGELSRALAGIFQPTTPEEQVIVAALHSGQKIHWILGELALNHPDWSAIQQLTQLLAGKFGSSWGILSSGANAAGASLAGAVPHRGPMGQRISAGRNLHTMMQTGQKLFFLNNLEPELDTVYDTELLERLKEADCVVALTPYLTPKLLEYADIILPTAVVSETAGTFVNTEGIWQTFPAATLPFKDSKPAWKIWVTLGQLLELNGFLYETTEAILAELRSHPIVPVCIETPDDNVNLWAPAGEGLVWVAPDALYSTDNVVRRASALQAMQGPIEARVNAKTAQRYGGTVDERVPDGVVWMPRGTLKTAGLGRAYGLLKELPYA